MGIAQRYKFVPSVWFSGKNYITVHIIFANVNFCAFKAKCSREADSLTAPIKEKLCSYPAHNCTIPLV